HYSALSRRSSAPDVGEMARRLSRYVEDVDVSEDEGVSGIRDRARPGARMLGHTDDALGEEPFVPLCSRAAVAPQRGAGGEPCDTQYSSGNSSGGSDGSSGTGQSPPSMPGATLMWTEPRPSLSTLRTASTRSPTPPDSPSLPPEAVSDVEAADPVSMATPAVRSPSRPAPPPLEPHGVTIRPLPPLPMSPLPPTPRRELPAAGASPVVQTRRRTEDLCAAQQHRDALEPCSRPKSLSDDAARSSASILSARTFLMSIASAQGAAGPGLTISTPGSGGAGRSDGDEPPVPVSAPVAESDVTQSLERQPGGTSSSAPAAHESESAEKAESPGVVAGSRSLRARSRLAGVGLRRASTYMWERSSVLVRALSSTDELPGGGQLALAAGAEGGAGGPEADGNAAAARLQQPRPHQPQHD
ncbi:hypothetical protein H4R21_006417, partial [Coemansia helicoidea]